MSPTTREVEAGRVERMRRQAAAKAAEQERPKPRNARERRIADLEAEHRAATSPNRWTCRLDGCPDAGRWTAADSREESLAQAHRHYMTRHYNPDPPYALRGLSASA